MDTKGRHIHEVEDLQSSQTGFLGFSLKTSKSRCQEHLFSNSLIISINLNGRGCPNLRGLLG